jgi:hypothetical protein
MSIRRWCGFKRALKHRVAKSSYAATRLNRPALWLRYQSPCSLCWRLRAGRCFAPGCAMCSWSTCRVGCQSRPLVLGLDHGGLLADITLPNAMVGWRIEKRVRNMLSAHWTQDDVHARVGDQAPHIIAWTNGSPQRRQQDHEVGLVTPVSV